MNNKEKILAFLKRKISNKILIAVLLILIVGVACLVTYNGEATVDTRSLNKLLVESSDLTTAKLNLTSMTEFSDEGVPIVNRADFIMVYDATVWAGIDVENVEISEPNVLTKTIDIKIPKATIQNVKIDPSSIKYFDEKFALFNVDEKEDANKAITVAEEKLKNEAVETGILELADKQSATLIKGLLSTAIPDGYSINALVKEQ